MPRQGVLALVLAAAAVTRTHAVPTLTGTVGPGFAITLKLNNKGVKVLNAGRLKLVIRDKASNPCVLARRPHGYAKDFTTIPFVGTKTFTLKLVAGKYKYYCTPHEPTMFGRFTVTG